MKVELSEKFLASLQRPETGRLEVSDAKRPGLRFRLSKDKAVWMYEKRIKGGRKRKHTLGTWPTPVSLADARRQALILEAEAAQGVDRIAEAEETRLAEVAARASMVSVRQVIGTYDRLHLANLRTREERLRQLHQSLEPHLDRSMQDLTKQDLQAAVDAKAGEGRKAYANRIRAALMAFSKWSWERGYMSENVAASIPRATKETARERVLSVQEVQAIWKATFEMGAIWGPVLRLMLLTCQRRGEILHLKWSQIDLDAMRMAVPGSRTKNKKLHITHLSKPAMQELQQLAETRNASDWVFSTTGNTPVSGIGKAKLRLDKILGSEFEPWRLHDIRTAFATAMAESGVPETIADRVLNHTASGSAPSAVARVYNRAEQLPQRAAALERWADHVTGGTGEIVRMVG